MGVDQRHVAIIREPYLSMILDGSKTVEARLTVRAIAPWRTVSPGDLVHLKRSGGAYRGEARVDDVAFIALSGVEDVMRLRRSVNSRVLGDAAYWESKTGAKYATLVTLGGVQAVSDGPDLSHLSGFARRHAWHVLPGATGLRASA